MRVNFFLMAAAIFYLGSCVTDKTTNIAEYNSDSFRISIDQKGCITELTDSRSNKDYLSRDTLSTLISIRTNNVYKRPLSAYLQDEILYFSFDKGIELGVKVEEKELYLTFELVSVSNSDSIDLVLWGPYFNTIGEVIGETVGVVRGGDYALGIQSLNIKTLGGYPWNESDRMPAFDIFRASDSENMHPDSDGSVLYRVEAAKPTREGSSLQAYCRNRSKERIIQDFNHDQIIAPAYDDGGVTGTKIALFGRPRDRALETIGEIEIGEGLPHPSIDGQWGKIAPTANAAYIITNFTEDNVDEAIAMTEQAGLRYLYHYGKTFETWGQFELYKGEFPTGLEGLKKCVQKAEEKGIMLGTHFLSNFISTDDRYVTPVPDKRLARVGSSVITESINATSSVIPIESPEFFNQMENNNLKTVMIGEELIRYGSVSETEPWRLLDCQRGAFNTVAHSHEKGNEISKLLDHAYKVFLTNAELTMEMSKTMADLYNQSGLRQISFDGLEGNRSTGLGTYGESLMPYTWYNLLSEDLKEHLIIDASRTTHFFWHIYTRMNWGEPWYGGFRESQTEYRFNNQAYFKRNYMPGMLGWFKMTSFTSVEDIQWLLARSAGYDAGYAFVADLEAVQLNGNANTILELLGTWENLRLNGSFSEVQKEMLRSPDHEFSLQKVGEETLNLLKIKTDIFRHESKVRQPGEPLLSKFSFTNIGEEQYLNFIISALETDAEELTIEIDNYKEIKITGVLEMGQFLKYSGGKVAKVYDENWQLLKSIEINQDDFKIGKGRHTLSFDCHFSNQGKSPELKIELRIVEDVQRINSKEKVTF